jgi:hypothetical protein
MELIMTVQQLRHTLYPPRNYHHDGLHGQSQSFLSSLSSTQLALFGHLPLRILIQIMKNTFLLRPEYHMISNKSTASLTIQSMISVIILWRLPLQMSPSLTRKFFAKVTICTFLRPWKLNSTITKLANTGL